MDRMYAQHATSPRHWHGRSSHHQHALTIVLVLVSGPAALGQVVTNENKRLNNDTAGWSG